MVIVDLQCFSRWKRWKLVGKLGNIVSATKMFLDLFANLFSFREAKFCFRNNVSRGRKTRNIIGNIMFRSLPGALENE